MRVPGPIFVGLFRASAPGGQPTCCGVLPTPGIYYIPQVPEGSYYLFAASFPWPEDIVACLLPDSRSALVGNVRCPVPVHRGKVTSHVNVSLRPLAATDPPILIALPALLPRQLGGDDCLPIAQSQRSFLNPRTVA
jgi:AraC family transcriptional regulator